MEVVHPEEEGLPPILRRQNVGSRGSPMKVITAAEIGRMGGQTLLDVIRAAEPHMVGGRQAGAAGGAAPLSGRGNNSVLMPQAPVVILDGLRIGDRPESVLRDIDPGSVARIEILKGPAGGWVHGEGAASGVIRVYTRKGGVPSDPETEPEDCGFSFGPSRP
jgi:outer membrane cobalamin receptor